ncbi:MAG: MerR family transcriptional regulator, partial [Alphaproteobacteria bacterium]|nr:MerR family transcriptional regulator [Alphaproteobacteria bacterium]
RPLKRAGGRRYYRPDDVTLLRRIRQCLYEQGYTIKGVQKLLREGALKTDDIPRLTLPTTVAAREGEKVDDMRRELFDLRRELIALREELKKLRG